MVASRGVGSLIPDDEEQLERARLLHVLLSIQQRPGRLGSGEGRRVLLDYHQVIGVRAHRRRLSGVRPTCRRFDEPRISKRPTRRSREHRQRDRPMSRTNVVVAIGIVGTLLSAALSIALRSGRVLSVWFILLVVLIVGTGTVGGINQVRTLLAQGHVTGALIQTVVFAILLALGVWMIWLMFQKGALN